MNIEHHAYVIPLMGASPISHMGHAIDLGGIMKNKVGFKVVGISDNTKLLNHNQRLRIIDRQWNQPDVQFKIVKSAGETIAHAFDNLPNNGKKILHLIVGADRRNLAEGLVKSLEAATVKEVNGLWDEIDIIEANEFRYHGLSGTAMRQAIADNDHYEFIRHIGASIFALEETAHLFKLFKMAIEHGELKVKRS